MFVFKGNIADHSKFICFREYTLFLDPVFPKVYFSLIFYLHICGPFRRIVQSYYYLFMYAVVVVDLMIFGV